MESYFRFHLLSDIDKDLPEAWMKGIYDETKGEVTIPVTFRCQR